MTNMDDEVNITRIFTIIDNYGTGTEAREAMLQWKNQAVEAERLEWHEAAFRTDPAVIEAKNHHRGNDMITTSPDTNIRPSESSEGSRLTSKGETE